MEWSFRYRCLPATDWGGKWSLYALGQHDYAFQRIELSRVHVLPGRVKCRSRCAVHGSEVLLLRAARDAPRLTPGAGPAKAADHGVELAAYCNERDFATYHTWCDETKSILNGTDYHLPALRLAQASAARLSDVYMIANLDLGSLHAPHGSIHSVPKDKLGARLALAIQASASTTSAVVWAGPTATGVSHGSQPWESAAGGKLVVHFNVSEGAGGLVLSNSESCPPTMLEIYCTEAGFEVRADGVWSPVKSATAGADHKSIVLEVTAKADRVRYAYSDWPLAMVRNRVGGLPARLFDMTVSAPASLNHSVVMLRVEEIHATTLKTDDDTAAAAAVTYHYPSDCCCENVYPRSAKNVVLTEAECAANCAADPLCHAAVYLISDVKGQCELSAPPPTGTACCIHKKHFDGLSTTQPTGQTVIDMGTSSGPCPCPKPLPPPSSPGPPKTKLKRPIYHFTRCSGEMNVRSQPMSTTI